MKRFYLLVLLFFVALPVLAATKNKISMVTYFPVPYVAYSQVNTTDQMDIGLTSTCNMKLGCSETSATLNASRVNLKGGKLNLDGGLGIKGYMLSLGSGNGEGRISFRNVRIQTGNMESVNAEDIKAANLNLFGKAFPSCKDANIESGGQMQWASLKLKGASSNELYLACGEVSESEEEPEEDPEDTCELNWVTCLLQEDKDFDESTCSCVDSYLMQSISTAFAFAAFPERGSTERWCLRPHYALYRNGMFGVANGADTFEDVRNSVTYEQGKYGRKNFPLDTDPNFPTRYSGSLMAVGATPREMIYQCSFTKDVKLKKLPCSPNTKECMETCCKTAEEGTLFWDEQYFAYNAQIAAFQPRASVDYNLKSNESYCVNSLYAGTMTSAGGSFVGWPCMSFEVRFWACQVNGKLDSAYNSIVAPETAEMQWAPNTAVKVQVID